MTDEEKAYVKDVCTFFFPDNRPAAVNEQLGDLAGVMLHEAIEKSKLFNLVPRPTGNRPGLLWLLLQAVQIFWRTQAKTRIYETVRKGVAYRYKQQYELARIGI